MENNIIALNHHRTVVKSLLQYTDTMIAKKNIERDTYIKELAILDYRVNQITRNQKTNQDNQDEII